MVDKNKLKELKRELERLQATKEGGLLGGLLWELSQKTSMAKGEKGDTPQKGIDYLTDKELNQIIDDMARKVQSLIRLPKDGETPIKGKDYFTDKEIEKIINEATKIVQSQIRIPEDGKTPIKGVDYFDGADGSPDTPEVIVSKIESIDEEDDKLKIESIKDLRKELDELKKLSSKVVYVGGGSGSGGHIVKIYDISDQLNGVLKTFSLPAFWRVISVHSSSFPNAFRPTTDYTTDASASTITFTSEITASSTLAAGQSVIIIYSE